MTLQAPDRARTGAPSRATATATLAAVAALACSPLAAAQSVTDRFGPNAPASSYGPRFDHLFSLITTLIGVSFLIVLVLLVVPLLRDRARPGKKAHYDAGTSLHDKRFTAIVSLTVFLVLDAWVLVVAMTDLREALWKIPTVAAGENPYRVEVLAQQWSWNFRVPGLDGEFGTPDDIVTINDLTLPKGRPAVFNVSSKDVIHSFFVPDMRVKRDANPGAINRVWFEPVAAGDYQILCAELCGYAHYQMQARLHVLDEASFAAWEQEAGHIAQAAYDDKDSEARWAWDWKE